jgi:hypothetical protein
MDRTQPLAPNESNDVQSLARSLGCFDEREVAALAGVQLNTLEAWRKRGLGPNYILFGRAYLYPRDALAQHLQSLVRSRQATPRRSAL